MVPILGGFRCTTHLRTYPPAAQDGMELLYAPEPVQSDRELVMLAAGTPAMFRERAWAEI